MSDPRAQLIVVEPWFFLTVTFVLGFAMSYPTYVLGRQKFEPGGTVARPTASAMMS